MKQEKQMELRALSESIMDVVTTAAGRRLCQALEMIHEEEIAPRDARIKRMISALGSAQDYIASGRQEGHDEIMATINAAIGDYKK